MPLKFRLRGLAETFVDFIRCPTCGHNGGDEGDQGFRTEHTRVTFDGIIVVTQCSMCQEIFMPRGQRKGVLDHQKLRDAVEKDGVTTGQAVLANSAAVSLEVERLNASRLQKIH